MRAYTSFLTLTIFLVANGKAAAQYYPQSAYVQQIYLQQSFINMQAQAIFAQQAFLMQQALYIQQQQAVLVAIQQQAMILQDAQIRQNAAAIQANSQWISSQAIYSPTGGPPVQVIPASAPSGRPQKSFGTGTSPGW